jgi:opacity protein-like surface antigen
MAVRAGRFVLALCVMTGPPAWAQPAQGPIVSGIVGAMAVDSRTDFSFSIAAGYRFNRAFGMGIELTSAPASDSNSDGRFFPALGPSIDFRKPEGQATVFTSNVRLEVPTTSPRVVPYAMAGGGIANVKESVDAIIAFQVAELTAPEMPAPTIYPPPYWYAYLYSSTSLALTFGGGVSILAGEHLSIDIDLRYLRLLRDTDRNVGRFGAGASYRF